jgi:hypothetical protein
LCDRDAPPVHIGGQARTVFRQKLLAARFTDNSEYNLRNRPRKLPQVRSVIAEPFRLCKSREPDVPKGGLHELLERDGTDDLALGDEVLVLDLFRLLDAVLLEPFPPGDVEAMVN